MSQHFDLLETVFKVLKFFIPFLFALCFHEFAHGWVAKLRGDRTAEIMGRLTLNPMAHADMIGTVIFPILAVTSGVPLFGWAKPVPVDERNLKNPRVDMFWISVAGPVSNFFLGVVGAIALGLYVKLWASGLPADDPGAETIIEVLKMFISINVFLAVFNMIPLHPLDGAKVLARFLPESANRWLEEVQGYSSLILLGLFFMGGFWIIGVPAGWLAHILLQLANGVAVS
jgi:Zn-dependent protease